MSLSAINNFYAEKPEPLRSCLLALRDIILAQDKNITAAWKYGMPFFCYRNKMFCYLWVHKKLGKPYLGLVDGKQLNYPELITEKRSRMKILLLDPNNDLPFETIKNILQKAISILRTVQHES